MRGWLALRRRDPRRWGWDKPAAFFGGLATIYLALASPIETFSAFLLAVHMTEHMLLMMVAAPLVWLGEPVFPLLRGVPRPIRAVWLAPLFRSPARAPHADMGQPSRDGAGGADRGDLALARAGGLRFGAAPARLALLATCLLFRGGAALLVSRRAAVSGAAELVDLAAAPLFAAGRRAKHDSLGAIHVCTAAALFALPGDPADCGGLGPGGSGARRRGHVAVRFGGVLDPAVLDRGPLALSAAAGLRLAAPEGFFAPPARELPRASISRRRFDLLRLPAIGPFLKWRHARLALQIPVAILAVAVIADGLFGPQVGAMNLAGVLPWIHWRGLLVVGLLVAGNLFCLGCPFLLPRMLARCFLPAGRSWPRWLRNKWLAVALLALFLWSYEAFSLWDSPRWTAWIAVGYFVAALVVNGFFRGAAFCKYVCPIGQFNFVQSLISPLEVKVREPDVCASCATKECIRGTGGGHGGIPGCELKLYQPRKQGNLDCTFCLDCVHACPHDNVGILAIAPGAELARDGFRSGIGHFSRRADLAALVLVLTFGAFANAAGMVGPIVDWEAHWTALFGWRSSLIAISLFYFAALVVAPSIAVGGAALLGRWWSGEKASGLAVAVRYAYAFVPLGFAMWLAHYLFHFLTSCAAIIPTTQRFAADLGWTFLGAPQWSCSCCAAGMEWLPRLEIAILDVGLLASLYVAYRIAIRPAGPTRAALKSLVPWTLVIGALFAVGVWIVLQPMQMRGMLPPPR